jgi:hypothetical protein
MVVAHHRKRNKLGIPESQTCLGHFPGGRTPSPLAGATRSDLDCQPVLSVATGKRSPPHHRGLPRWRYE